MASTDFRVTVSVLLGLGAFSLELARDGSFFEIFVLLLSDAWLSADEILFCLKLEPFLGKSLIGYLAIRLISESAPDVLLDLIPPELLLLMPVFCLNCKLFDTVGYEFFFDEKLLTLL